MRSSVSEANSRRRSKVFAKTDGLCCYCGAPINQDAFEVGHIRPQVAGGGNRTDNLVPSCGACNRAKGSRSVESFVDVFGYLRSGLKGIVTYPQARELVDAGFLAQWSHVPFRFPELLAQKPK